MAESSGRPNYPKPLGPDQVERLAEAAQSEGPLTELAVRVPLVTGMSARELVAFRSSWLLDDEDQALPAIHVYGDDNPESERESNQRRARDNRRVPVREEAVFELLQSWFSDRSELPLKREDVNRMIARTADQADISQEVTVRTLRYTLIRQLLEIGLRREEIIRNTGVTHDQFNRFLIELGDHDE